MDFDPDRANRYRQLAAEARGAAALASQPYHREAYLNIAKGWASLVEHAEREVSETGQPLSAADGPRLRA
jgi:hypothetical protein